MAILVIKNITEKQQKGQQNIVNLTQHAPFLNRFLE